MINSLWHSKNLNKSFVFKSRPDIGETFKNNLRLFQEILEKNALKIGSNARGNIDDFCNFESFFRLL